MSQSLIAIVNLPIHVDTIFRFKSLGAAYENRPCRQPLSVAVSARACLPDDDASLPVPLQR